MQQKYINYLNKVDTTTELLLKRYTDLVGLSNTKPNTNDEEGKETDKGTVESNSKQVQKGLNINMIAASTLSLESNASNIVRLLEELLMITKTLKENWLLNRLPNSISELQDHYDEKSILQYENQNDKLESMVNKLIKEITDTQYFD